MQVVRRAEHYYRSGYNCAEAVLLSAAECYELGLGSEGVRLAAGFGGGMGGGYICGAITGALIALGAALGRDNSQQGPEPLKSARDQMLAKFQEVTGGMNCADLKTGEKEDCVQFVRAAGKALAEVLANS